MSRRWFYRLGALALLVMLIDRSRVAMIRECAKLEAAEAAKSVTVTATLRTREIKSCMDQLNAMEHYTKIGAVDYIKTNGFRNFCGPLIKPRLR